MFTNYPVNNYYEPSYQGQEERFFLAPFLVGGLAGTALGFGIANNNQMNHSNYYPYQPLPAYYSPPMPMIPSYTTSNYYYY